MQTLTKTDFVENVCFTRTLHSSHDVNKCNLNICTNKTKVSGFKKQNIKGVKLY